MVGISDIIVTQFVSYAWVVAEVESGAFDIGAKENGEIS